MMWNPHPNLAESARLEWGTRQHNPAIGSSGLAVVLVGMAVAPGPVFLLFVFVELAEIAVFVAVGFAGPLLVVDALVVVPAVIVVVVRVVGAVVVVIGATQGGEREHRQKNGGKAEASSAAHLLFSLQRFSQLTWCVSPRHARRSFYRKQQVCGWIAGEDGSATGTRLAAPRLARFAEDERSDGQGGQRVGPFNVP